MSEVHESFDQIFRLCVPYGVILCLLLLNALAPSFLLAGSLEAPFMVMAIFYWSTYRPTLVPLWLVFFLGLFLDLLLGVPVGLNALIFVCVRWLVTDQRLFLTGQPFMIIWFGYVIVSALATFLQWALFGLFQFILVPIEQVAFSIIYGGALFPLICLILHATHKLLPEMPGDYRHA